MNNLAMSDRRPAIVISPELQAVIGSHSGGFFGRRETDAERNARLRRGDVAPGLVLGSTAQAKPSAGAIAEARRVLPLLERELDPLPAHELFAVVKHLTDMLNGAAPNPQDEGAMKMRRLAMLAALSDTPAGVWGDELTKAALRRFKFFPSVAELAELLDEVAAPLRDKVAHVRIVSRQEAREPERPRPTDAEREAVREMMAARRAEVAKREAHEAKIRKHGTYTPPGAEGLTGWALLDALKADLPNLDGDLLAVTQERVEEMQRRFEAAERFMTSEAQA
ncbi:hypothetical protein AA0311_1503 [Asaia bogorensis NBRC 16594]|uniref:Uncharacterized protein n=2 Tax=Asaia bogorensis TaxID=91915 RepID=A0AAN4R3U0_9PROT|nr:hypothetical protein Asbog_01533 [Asaia bogorensis NBRC 16594]GBQ77638.1 hypothetical protein AA0311_1503 [Asaia bogorensis NBRC 16594]GEL54354.1 hypothetical protein ABO01nite_23610 [Asaia bogorensis NBRC 16594]